MQADISSVCLPRFNFFFLLSFISLRCIVFVSNKQISEHMEAANVSGKGADYFIPDNRNCNFNFGCDILRGIFPQFIGWCRQVISQIS